MLAALGDDLNWIVSSNARYQLKRLGENDGTLSKAQLPSGSHEPKQLWRLLELELVELEPWFLLQGRQLERRFDGVKQHHRERCLVAFARRQSNNEVTCWDVDAGGEKVVIIELRSCR